MPTCQTQSSTMAAPPESTELIIVSALPSDSAATVPFDLPPVVVVVVLRLFLPFTPVPPRTLPPPAAVVVVVAVVVLLFLASSYCILLIFSVIQSQRGRCDMLDLRSWNAFIV